MEASAPLLSLVVVTMRPWFLPATRAMLDRQSYRQVEIVIALHGHKVSDLPQEQRQALEGVRAVLELPADWSLGHCLNATIAEANGEFVAKIDDDDLYGRDYVAEMIRHLVAGDGDVVGKAEAFFYLEATGAILLRKPGLSRSRVKFVHGATLAFPRVLARECPFQDVSNLEDTLFLQDCGARGLSVYASSRRNFMVVRRAATDTHTWTQPDHEMFKMGILIKEHRHATRAELLSMIENMN